LKICLVLRKILYGSEWEIITRSEKMKLGILKLLPVLMLVVFASFACGGGTSTYTVNYTAVLTGASTFDEVAWDDGDGGTQKALNANPNWTATLLAPSGAKVGLKASATSTNCKIVLTVNADDGKGNLVSRTNTTEGSSNIPQVWTSETDHPVLP